MRARGIIGAGLVCALIAVVTFLLVSPAVSREGRHVDRFVLGAADDTTTPFNLVSVPALIRHTYDGHGLRRVQLERRDRAASTWLIEYVGDGRRLAGALSVPNGGGRHPVIVTMHGWVPPAAYPTGGALSREDHNLAARGYVVLHPDYRNFGDSSAGSRGARRLLGYPADVLNAVVALRRAHLPGVDTSRIGLLGRSMGGGVALQVAEARPAWFRALVLNSPVSAEAASDYERWVAPDKPLRRRVTAAYGTPRSDPALWARASSANYLRRLTMPVRIHHGTADPVCPVSWSERTADQMRAAAVDVRLRTYAGEQHRFAAAWPRYMSRVDRFFAATVRQPAG